MRGDQCCLNHKSLAGCAVWRFNVGRVVVLGDASHSMSPQLGQGANLALIDAEKLVDCLQREALGEASGGGVEAALAAYTRERWWRLQFYQAQSRLLTPVFASHSELIRSLERAPPPPTPHPLDLPPVARTPSSPNAALPLRSTEASRGSFASVRAARNALLYPGCHTPLLRTFMHKVLCGAQTPDLRRPWGTIPEEEFLGFLEDLPAVGAALRSGQAVEGEDGAPPELDGWAK